MIRCYPSPLWTRPRRSPRMSGPTSRAYGVIPSYGDPYIATAASAKDDVEIDGWSTLLCTDDQDPGSLGGSDRDRAALVDEVLVPGEPAAYVGRQSLGDLRLRADRTRNGHVALRERNPDGQTEAEDRTEEAQQATDQEDKYESAASREAAAATRAAGPPASPFGHGCIRLHDRRSPASWVGSPNAPTLSRG